MCYIVKDGNFGKRQKNILIKMKKGNPGRKELPGNPRQPSGATKIKPAWRGRDVLIKEIHHRFINQLNLIYNILYFRKQYTEDSRCLAILDSVQKQIKSIALAHEHLRHSMDFNQVRVAEYLKSLIEEIEKTAGRANKKVTFKTKIDSVCFGLTTTVTCGLIVSELLDNSLKHAFPAGRRAEVFVGLKDLKDGAYALTVSDNGRGLPADVQWHLSATMGSFLVNTLAENLKGELTVDIDNGTSFHLRFNPLSE
jgi:two-component sensor histidine kinase